MLRSLSQGFRGHEGAVAVGIWLVVMVAVVLCFWPGHMNADTLLMIDQAAGTLPITDHHSPILVWLWSLGWPIGLRPGVILILQVGAFLAGSYLIARAAFRPIGASVVAALVAISPPALGYLGTISRDTWFIALLMLSFGLVIMATRRTGRQATLALVGAGLAATLCLASRQNAGTAVVLAAIAIVGVAAAPSLRPLGAVKRVLVAIGVGLTATIAVAATLLLAVRVADVDRARPEQQLFIYDLSALSLREGEVLLPPSVYGGDLATLAGTTSMDSIVNLVFGEAPSVPVPLSEPQVADLRDAWWDQVRDDPLAYLDLRTDAWLRQIGIDRAPVFVYHPGIDENARGYEIAFDGLNGAMVDYLNAFTVNDALDGSFVYRPWIYLVAALAAAILLLALSPPLWIVGAFAATAWTYQVGLFFGSMGTVYRFEYPVVVTGMLGSLVAAKAVIDWRRERRAPDAEPAATHEPAPEGPERPAPVGSGAGA